MRAIFVFLAAIVLAGPGQAESHVSERLAAAVEAWLADDDATALPALSELAGEGDEAAITLLGRIAARPDATWTPYVAGLSREDREGFLNPGGFDILAVRALAGDELAEAFIAAEKPEAGVEVAETLLAAGEEEAARAVIWRAMENGRVAEVLEQPADGALRGSLDYLYWIQAWVAAGHASAEPEKWVTVGPEAGRASGLILASWLTEFIAADKPLPPNLKRVAAALDGSTGAVKDDGEIEYLEKMLVRLGRRDPALVPAAAVCKRLCADETGACMVESMRLLGGYDAAMEFDTPLESVIPQMEFARSARAEGEFERRLRAAANPGGASASACLSSALAG
ncbi:MAG: hypothetical protein AAGF90_04480 [Pseudomonadota bacterium]